MTNLTAPPVTAWVPHPADITSDIPLWELRPWYAAVVSRHPVAGDDGERLRIERGDDIVVYVDQQIT